MIQKISLLELNRSIQEKIKLNFPESLWVVAEISELKINRNGHCYLELIEKDALNENIIAKSRATIWAFTFRMLKPYFESVTGHELASGLKILIRVTIEFHELYGFSLNITDIDPNYTLGDLAQKKAETLRKLEEDGIINMNKELEFPIVPQKIAVISSQTAAGYQDFMHQLTNNKYGYKYYIKLFPSLMQGLQAEESIIDALERIFKNEHFFDVVVLIRGGGSQADLNCFNNYLLAANVAQYPIPVLTGIGHDKDESIVDMVAHQKLKTPTAVAEYIIEKTLAFEQKIDFYKERIYDIAIDFINHQKTKLIQSSSIFIPITKNILDKQNNKFTLLQEKFKNSATQLIHKKNSTINSYISSIQFTTTKTLLSAKENIIFYKKTLITGYKHTLKNNNSLLNNFKNKVTLLDPTNILKRGYSITFNENQKIITNIQQISINDEVITKLFDGEFRSTIKVKTKLNQKNKKIKK
ncbi:MAG: exodeoxyribonuclease VII large subunit [Bacteroidota bacterium]|nr:exodeoxyribonuclease VII large subunit [Bacteroidota bacterium]